MLTLTENAVMAARSIVADIPDPRSAGLRIRTVDGGDTRFTLTPVTGPEQEDAVVEEGGVRIFLSPEAAPLLETETLDADVDATGGVRFALAGA